jgi:REP element-mobilizing transposase RayT
MLLQPLYFGVDLNPAFCLRYSWSGWPAAHTTFDNLRGPEILDDVTALWETDGLRLLEYKWSSDKIQLTFSTTPDVSPVFLASRAKGRLRHALRKADNPQNFSRKLSVRSIGNNTAKQVEAYIAQQVHKERFVDPEFAKKMQEFTVIDPNVDLSKPSHSGRGRYWYNLHIVLEVVERLQTLDLGQLEIVRDGCLKIATKKGYLISRLSAMLDHVHLALRGDQARSPADIVLAFQNNLAFLLGQEKAWRETFYAGTFSEYDMGAVRNSPSIA